MKFALLLLVALAVGCASSPQRRYSRLETGMTRQQVVALLGEPRQSISRGALTVMEFDFAQRTPAALHAAEPHRTSYYVIIGRDERVRSFGPS